MFLLLDTDVVIDLRRQHPPALAWLSRTRSANYALPGLVVLELLNGAPHKSAARAIELFTSRFRVFWPTVADREWQSEDVADFDHRVELRILVA